MSPPRIARPVARRPEPPAGCSIEGCSNPAARSVAGKGAAKALAPLKLKDERRAHLCRDHYRQYRKATKEDRELERLGW